MDNAFFTLVGILVGSLLNSFLSRAALSSQQTHTRRVAALERRLDSHQKLYALWAEFKNNLYDDSKRTGAEMELRKWWNENCLYLDPGVRAEFVDCLAESCQFPGWRDRREREALEYHRRVVKMFELIERSVNLPPIGYISGEHAQHR